jgi:sigma-B regulation protein RsbU (phosphoserine phosphatase)
VTASLDVAAVYRPAGDGSEVGGDFYDIFQIGVGDWVIAIGDVQGKGTDAAVITALARHTIRAAAVTQCRPSAILTTLNAVLSRDDSDRFCTVAVVRLHRENETWIATTSCGGHPPPLLRRAGEDPRPVEAQGSLLGVIHNPNLTDVRHTLATGDALLLYTDGLTEARNGTEFFGDAQLTALMVSASSSAEELANAVFRAVMEYQAGIPRDDIAIVAVSVP